MDSSHTLLRSRKPAPISRKAARGIASVAMFLSACSSTPPTTLTPLTWTVPADAKTQIVNGYPLTFSSRGAGPTVIFVGGVLTDYRVWKGPLTKWEPDYHVEGVSLRHFYPERWRGTGSDFSVAQHARDLDAFIESQGGPVYLVGWSYGAHVAYEAARARPDLVKKLVLAEAPLDSLLATTDEGANAIRIKRAEITAKFFEAENLEGGMSLAIDAINGPGAWAASPEPFRQLMRENAWTVVGIGREEAHRVTCAEFGSLKMPVLLVQGELTTLRFHQIVAEESKCLPSAKVVTIPKAGHASPLMNPEGFRLAATNFLAE